MFILLILLTTHNTFTTTGMNSTSQQIEFKTKEACENTAKQLRKSEYIRATWCIQKD